MKKPAPVWPVLLLLAAVIAIVAMDVLVPEGFVFDEKWGVTLALGLVVVRLIYTLHISRKPNPSADVMRMRKNIERGLGDKN